jgi:hypothetical protein
VEIPSRPTWQALNYTEFSGINKGHGSPPGSILIDPDSVDGIDGVALRRRATASYFSGVAQHQSDFAVAVVPYWIAFFYHIFLGTRLA